MALWTVDEDVCLVIPFELWLYCTTVFAAVVPRRCVVFRSKLSAVRCAAWVSRPPTVGAATAIAWWRCSGCLAYVIMDSVREKEEKEGKTAAMVGVFVLPEREKRAFSVAFASLLCLSLHQILQYFSFLPNRFIMRFFQVLAFSSLCMLALFGAVSCDDISAEPDVSPPSVKISAAGGEATAKVLRMDGGKLRTKWAYKSVEVQEGIFYRRDSTLRIDTLTDGRVKYSSTWYAFYVNMAKNEIHVVVSPNKSKNQRSVQFLGNDLYGAGLVSFAVDQEADSTATN